MQNFLRGKRIFSIRIFEICISSLRELTQDFEPERFDGVVEEQIRELLRYVDDYSDTYKTESDCSVGERGLMIEKIRSAIEKAGLPLSVDADEFHKMC